MATREMLAQDFRPDPAGQILCRVVGEVRAGQFRVITDRQRADYEAAVQGLPMEGVEGMAVIGERESQARGLEIGFYRDLSGQVRHVQDERFAIEADAATLRAADHGLVTLGDKQRAFMERRVDMLERWDNIQTRRLSQPQMASGY